MMCLFNPAARTRVVLLLALLVAVTVTLGAPITHAQGDNYGWSTPTLLFESEHSIFEPEIVSDQAGNLHVFWRLVETIENSTEAGFEYIYYMRWDGNRWTEPIDVVSSSTARAPSAVVDQNGMLHLIWQDRLGELYYSRAPATAADSAHEWATPSVVARTQPHAQIVADSTGRVHMAYAEPGTSGVYYRTSDDGGVTWSFPANVSGSSTAVTLADWVRLDVSPGGIIHVVWSEFQIPDGWPPARISYARSTDGGATWSEAVAIADEGYDQINVVAVDDYNVHVAWNGQAGVTGRYHRWSGDGGQSWSEVVAVIPPGESGGTTGPPQLVVDSARTLHMLTTDDAVYTYLTEQGWARPFTIAAQVPVATEFTEDAVMTVSEGNRLHAVFWEDRKRLWYSTRQTSAPVDPAVPLPTLTAAPTPSAVATEVPSPTPTPAAVVPPESTPEQGETGGTVGAGGPGTAILAGILPVLLLVGSVALFRTLRSSRQ